MKIGINEIGASPYQPRLEFDLEDLKGSIIKDGILVPLTVRKLKDHYYELIDGERRLRLARELGYKEVPCEVVKADDEAADRMVWKVNTLRKDYKPKEKARHYKQHQDQGMSLRGIAKGHDTDHMSVCAHINVFKLPDKYQKLVWNGPLSVSHIQELSSFLNGDGVATPLVIEKLDQALEKKLTHKELRKVIRPELEEIEKKRIKAAQKASRKLIPKIKIETPEDYDKAAEALKREAKKKREVAIAKLTPEEKAKLEAEKKKKAKEQERKKTETKRKQEERLEKKAAKRAKKLKKTELMKDEKFLWEIHSEVQRQQRKKLEEELTKIGAKVEMPSEPEIVLKLEVQAWINEVTIFTSKLQAFEIEKLTEMEKTKLLMAYMILYENLDKKIPLPVVTE